MCSCMSEMTIFEITGLNNVMENKGLKKLSETELPKSELLAYRNALY